MPVSTPAVRGSVYPRPPRLWTVLETGLSYQNRTEVSKIKQEWMGADGTTVEATDTIYISATATGEFRTASATMPYSRPFFRSS